MRRIWPLLLFFAIFIVISTSHWQQNKAPILPKQDHFNRIVSLAPSITETLYAIGGQTNLIAVTKYCDYPKEARSLPKIGGYIDTSLEAIVAHNPDLVILLSGQQKLQQQLDHLGIETLTVDNTRLQGIQDSIQKIGDKIGQPHRAQQLVHQIQLQIKDIQQRVSALPQTRVMVSIAHYANAEDIETVYIAGQHDFYNDLIELAGGENVYQDKVIKIPTLTYEGIIRVNPDVIIDVFPEADDHDSDIAIVKQQWQNLSWVNAVKNDRIHIIEEDYASIPGPRIFNLLPLFAEYLHPNLDWTRSPDVN